MKMRNVMENIFVVVALLCGFLGRVSGCTVTNGELPNLRNRSVNQNIFVTGGIVVDDVDLKTGWYRTNIDGLQYVLADNTSMPQLESCGSLYVIYIDGVHPDPFTMKKDEVITQTACLVDIFSNCSKKYDIKIRKCEGEIQYYLIRSAVKYTSYCFDLDLPWFSSKPTVRPGMYRNTFEHNGFRIHDPKLTFECNFQQLPAYNYTVTWFKNDQQFVTYGPSENESAFTLDEDTLLAENVTLGINILNSTVFVEKDSIFTIPFQLTVPIGCYRVETPFPNIYPCEVELSMIDVSRDNSTCNKADIQSYGYSCDAKIETIENITEWNASKVYTKQLVTTDRNYADPNTSTLQLQIDNNTGHKIWRSYQPGRVTVIVTEKNYRLKTCYANIDPHMKTADGIYYEHQKSGDYLLYKNTFYDIEAQVRFGSCGSYHHKARCTCAIVIRAGADIFEIDICNRTRHVGFDRCDDGGILQVSRVKDTLYEVYSPIGTIIKIQMSRLSSVPVMSVEVHMAPKDFSNTVGLCGYYDDNRNNDLQKRSGFTVPYGGNQISYYPFSDDWQLLENETLFDGKNYYEHQRWDDTGALFCYCNETSKGVFKSVCSPVLDKGCAFKVRNDQTKKLCLVVGNRKKRSLVSDGHYVEIKRRLNRANMEDDHVIQKRQNTVTINKEEANEICNQTLTKSAAAGLGLLDESEIEAAVKNCVYDSVEMNDATFAYVHDTLLTNTINTEIEKDPVYQNESKEMIEEFRLHSCNCNGNGICTDEGICDCSDGFHGHDCSIDEAEALVLDDLTGAGFCDTAMDTCECYDVITLNLLEDFLCHTKQILVHKNLTEETIYSSTHTGLRISTFEGECCVPQQIDMSLYGNGLWVKYIVSISNVGISYSNSRTLNMFDGSCQNPSSDDSESAHVELNNDVCFIDGICYTESQTALSNTCLVCKPSVDQHQWTYDCAEESPSTTVLTSSTSPITLLGSTKLMTSSGMTNDMKTSYSVTSTVNVPETSVLLMSKTTEDGISDTSTALARETTYPTSITRDKEPSTPKTQNPTRTFASSLSVTSEIPLTSTTPDIALTKETTYPTLIIRDKEPSTQETQNLTGTVATSLSVTSEMPLTNTTIDFALTKNIKYPTSTTRDKESSTQEIQNPTETVATSLSVTSEMPLTNTTIDIIKQTEEGTTSAQKDDELGRSPLFVVSAVVGTVIIAVIFGIVVFIRCKSKKPSSASTASRYAATRARTVNMPTKSTYYMSRQFVPKNHPASKHLTSMSTAFHQI